MVYVRMIKIISGSNNAILELIKLLLVERSLNFTKHLFKKNPKKKD